MDLKFSNPLRISNRVEYTRKKYCMDSGQRVMTPGIELQVMLVQN